MLHSLRSGALSRWLAFGGWAAMGPTLAVAACGRATTPTAVARSASPASPSAHASAESAPPPLPPAATETTQPAPFPVPAAPTPASTVATTRTDPSWASCHRLTTVRGPDVASDVAAMARGCAASTHMKLVGTTLVGKQAAEDAPQIFPLAARGSHCYRVYAQAAGTIEDLDVVVKDSASTTVAQDSTEDQRPVVLEDGEVCFRQDDRATVVVSVGRGKGSYALQIWGD